MNKWYAQGHETGYHQVNFVEDWDKIDISEPWNVAFIDHESHRRAIEASRLANNADYVVVHDSQGRRDYEFHYTCIYPLFKYRYDFVGAWTPFTTVLSNFKDLANLCI